MVGKARVYPRGNFRSARSAREKVYEVQVTQQPGCVILRPHPRPKDLSEESQEEILLGFYDTINVYEKGHERSLVFSS